MDLRMRTFNSVESDNRFSNRGLGTEPTLEDPVSVLSIMWERQEDKLFISIRLYRFLKFCLKSKFCH